MGKPHQKLITRGVQHLNLPSSVMNLFFRKAESFLPKHNFLRFEPHGNQVIVKTRNDRQLDTIQITLPQMVWLKTDDYGDRLVITALMPQEY